MRLTQKQKDDLMAALHEDDFLALVQQRPFTWGRFARMIAFWLVVIAIPFLLLFLIPSR